MPVRIDADPGSAPLFRPASAGTPQEFARAWRLPPEEALRYMAARDRVRVSYDWRELWHDEHARAFTVSRLARADLLQGLRDGLQASVAGDLSRRDWTRSARELLSQAGWWGERQVTTPDGRVVTTTFDPHRLRLIYDVNTRMAYAAGRWERIQAAKATHPYLRYVTRADERVRESHRPWHGVSLPVDDPWWRTHYPPNGWRCRCRAVPMRRSEYDRRDDLVKRAPEDEMVPWVDTRSGIVHQVPSAVDPGFAYNVGEAAARWQGLIDAGRQKVSGYAADIGAANADALGGLAARDWAQWLPAAQAQRAGRRPGWLGVVAPDDLAHLNAAGIVPLTAEVMVRPGLVAGPKARRHEDRGDALTAADWQGLPQAWARGAQALLLDVRTGKLLWVLRAQAGRPAQLAMEIDFVLRRPKRTTNAVKSAYRVDSADLRGRIAGGQVRVLWGSVE
jgi:SPP1 gp7 family putative phage head morphogenesis protein